MEEEEEVGREDEGEGTKRMKLDKDTEFAPFQYQGSNFTDYTHSESTTYPSVSPLPSLSPSASHSVCGISSQHTLCLSLSPSPPLSLSPSASHQHQVYMCSALAPAVLIAAVGQE